METKTNELTAEAVHATLMDCLFRDGEPSQDFTKAAGVMNTFGLHPERLESHRAEVLDWISQLPKEFLKSGGGGWSFLNLCNRADGEQWTREHRTMDALFTLANGLGVARFLMPRDMWSVLPGGMPYVQFDSRERA